MSAFSRDDDFVTRARADHHFSAGAGTLVQVPDGRVGTIVYNNLDGYGIVWGDRPDLIGAADWGELPEPDAMLRDPYPSLKYEAAGDLVRVLRKVKADGSVVKNITKEDARAVE